MKHRTILLAIVALCAALVAPGAPAAVPDQTVLQESVVVSANVIRLGDLFSGAGKRANDTVAYAPAPGKRAVFDSRWLYRVARAYGLKWRPLTLKDRAVVERASTTIGRDEIESRILEALIDNGVSADVDVRISNRMLKIHVPEDAEAVIEIEDIAYNPRTRHFTSIVSAPSHNSRPQRLRVTGRVFLMREVPVPTRRVLADEIIRDTDIEWISVRADHLRRDTIMHADQIIGKSPRHSVRAGQPIRVREVRNPVLVPKRSLVTILFKKPRLTLTAKGRALDDGSDGQVIRIANAQSNTVIEATVVGAHMVAVHTPDLLATNPE
ncbi:MAG: flagellar basal body P-ring formation protein FlgA [Rhodospirillales bacterium]|jgi:flagellar basal body P-ring formation protein FlgA|nr:flagellar basal body P-ring formation protein FlgA [Rhodospirillales bacterium]